MQRNRIMTLVVPSLAVAGSIVWQSFSSPGGIAQGQKASAPSPVQWSNVVQAKLMRSMLPRIPGVQKLPPAELARLKKVKEKTLKVPKGGSADINQDTRLSNGSDPNELGIASTVTIHQGHLIAYNATLMNHGEIIIEPEMGGTAELTLLNGAEIEGGTITVETDGVLRVEGGSEQLKGTKVEIKPGGKLFLAPDAAESILLSDVGPSAGDKGGILNHQGGLIQWQGSGRIVGESKFVVENHGACVLLNETAPTAVVADKTSADYGKPTGAYTSGGVTFQNRDTGLFIGAGTFNGDLVNGDPEHAGGKISADKAGALAIIGGVQPMAFAAASNYQITGTLTSTSGSFTAQVDTGANTYSQYWVLGRVQISGSTLQVNTLGSGALQSTYYFPIIKSSYTGTYVAIFGSGFASVVPNPASPGYATPTVMSDSCPQPTVVPNRTPVVSTTGQPFCYNIRAVPSP